jgi:hypothetical protein
MDSNVIRISFMRYALRDLWAKIVLPPGFGNNLRLTQPDLPPRRARDDEIRDLMGGTRYSGAPSSE